MKRRVFLFVLLTAFCMAGCSRNAFDYGGQNGDLTTLYEKVINSVVHIETNVGGGTGFFIEEDIIATNNHVINGAVSIKAKTVDGVIYTVTEILAHSENPDLALLKVDGKQNPVTICDDVKMGEQIFTIGAPMGIFPTITDGIVANNSFEENGVNFILSNINSISGNSGGPVFNMRGEVVGVIQGGISDGNNGMDMIICAKHLDELDKSNPILMSDLAEKPDEEKYEIVPVEEAEVGKLISFGRYEQDTDLENGAEEILWLVLEKDGNKLKLMSLYCLDVVPFHTEEEEVTWESSYVRQFLNSDFYNNAFNTEERADILTMTIYNTPNPIHGTYGGNNTEDRVHLLSLEEVAQYYNIEEYNETFYEQLYAQATQYVMDKGVWLEIDGSSKCWWWLRSMGGNPVQAAEVGSAGYLSFNGSLVLNGERAVRPVIWIDAE